MRKWSDFKKVFRHKEKEKVSYTNITAKNCITVVLMMIAAFIFSALSII